MNYRCFLVDKKHSIFITNVLNSWITYIFHFFLRDCLLFFQFRVVPVFSFYLHFSVSINLGETVILLS